MTGHDGQPDRVEGYERFFGLSEPPFSLAPDPRFLFTSASHSAALAQVTYALERREPLVVITGEIGTGKTLLCRTVLQRLRRKTFLSVISDPLLERDDLLKQLLQDFGVISRDRTKRTEATRYELVQALQAFLASLSPIQAHAVVIIDEAQHLLPDVLEQIRLLSNFDDERGTLLQIILVGQIGLEPLLARPELRQLQQRVSRRFSLQPLNNDEVQQYVEHRLATARDGSPRSQVPGATELAQELAAWSRPKTGVEFAPEAVQALSQLSGGLPRMINLLCDRALEAAFQSGVRIVDGPLIHAASRALGIGAIEVATTPVDPNPTAQAIPTAFDDAPRGGEPSHPDTRAAIAQSADEAGAGFRPQIESIAATSGTRYLIMAASLAVVAVAIWFGVRATRTTTTPSSATTSSSVPAGSGARSDPPSAADAIPSAPNAGAGASTAAAPPAAASATAPAAATTTDSRFEIIVASFRTEVRASSVAADLAAVGLPIRQRATDGWQQIVCGPFASRSDAEAAQQRLDRAGFTGSQIAVAR